MSLNLKQIFGNLGKIAAEKDVDKTKIIEILKFALEKAYLKESPDSDVEAIIDADKESVKLVEKKIVVDKSEEEIDDDKEINLSEALKIKKSAKLNDVIVSEINIRDFERRVANHVSQIFGQKLNEISNFKVYDQWKDKIGSIIRAEVERVENKYVEVNLGSTMGVVIRSEQIPNEKLEPGKSYLFLIKDIKEQSKGWPIILSRADSRLLEFLFVNNIPEVEKGIIKIKRIARIPGYKSKIAVISEEQGVDPIGTCVGPKGERIKNISALINNEKIDIIIYSDNPKQLLVNACSPEKIVGLEITDDVEENGKETKIVTIVCEENSLSKLIGRSGVNVKLLSMLTHWSIDVISLEVAKTDQINYEDVSHMAPLKQLRNSQNNYGERTFNSAPKKPKVQWGYDLNNDAYNKNNSVNSFEQSFIEENTFDEITDEDIENLLNFNSGDSKKKKKEVEEDEEIIYVTNEDSAQEEKTLDNTSSSKNDKKSSSKSNFENFDEKSLDKKPKESSSPKKVKHQKIDILEDYDSVDIDDYEDEEDLISQSEDELELEDSDFEEYSK
ncbi:MAG: transcription termination factor NusA [Malacoplasma sp.]|nr:transcription termination factor NusA [Malacoplasma sp.]